MCLAKCTMLFKTINPRLSKLFLTGRIADALTFRSTKMLRENRCQNKKKGKKKEREKKKKLKKGKKETKNLKHGSYL